jgi:hypothetical protein
LLSRDHLSATGYISSSRCQKTHGAALARCAILNGRARILSALICSVAGVAQDPSGGARRDRTDDLMLAKHALSQLSYGPKREANEQAVVRAATKMVGLGRLELPTSRLSSARSNQLSYKPDPPHIPAGSRNLGGLVREERETKTAGCPA